MRVLSTKKLLQNQRELLLNAGVSFVEYDAISIIPTAFDFPDSIENVIISSQNGARALLNHDNFDVSKFQNVFVVGEKSKRLLAQNGLKISKTAKNGAELGDFIIKNNSNNVFTFFCGNRRRDEIPSNLAQNSISCNEIVVYETHLHEKQFDQAFEMVLFFSPSGVSAFAKANVSKRAVCIGETTASEAKKHIENVSVANSTTVESVIAKAVKILKELSV